LDVLHASAYVIKKMHVYVLLKSCYSSVTDWHHSHEDVLAGLKF